MPEFECSTTTLFLLVFHVTGLCSLSAQINSAKYSKRPSGELSMNNTIEIVNSHRSVSQCAARCSRTQQCTAFVYSMSRTLCYLGSAVCNVTNSSYPPDYQIFKSDLDYYTAMECSSNDRHYIECPLPYMKSATLKLLEQLSTSNCTLEDSYGLSADNHLWVNLGCRARFAIGV